MQELLYRRESLTHSALVLRTFEALFGKPPKCVYDVRRNTVDILLADEAHPLMHMFVTPLTGPQKCDLDSVFSREPVGGGPESRGHLFAELIEIQGALGRWRGVPFVFPPAATARAGRVIATREQGAPR